MKTDASGWVTRLDDEMAATYAASGQWNGRTLRDCALDCARRHPQRLAVVDGDIRLDFGQLLDRALRLASALRRRGLAPGDVVSFQLPNWHEAMVINLAAAISGLVSNPIVPIYRDAEVRFILTNSRTKVLFIPELFRGFDYRGMADGLRAGLPNLQHVVLLRSSQPGRDDAYERWLLDESAPVEDFPPVDPNAVKLLLYTSGTTGEPKGVLHSHNTLRADNDATIAFRGLRPDDVMLMPSPVTHITGYLYALELPFALGMTVVLMERWQAAQAVQLIDEHHVTLSSGATPFLSELIAELEKQSRSLASLRLYVTGGAPVPPEVVRRADLMLPNCRTYRAYGCSEAPTVSLGVAQGDPAELGATTDGRVHNHEVKIVDAATGEPLETGQIGEILTRGPEVMLGYTDPAHTQEAFDADGYFRTGDLGWVDQRGYLTISGRKKDLILRGGENLSPKEIEDVLHRHPCVLEAAVVAMPHARMGETPCAYVVIRPGKTFDFDAMTNWLEAAKLARQKFPERLVLVDALPHNAAGKVLKHLLRAQLELDAAAPV